MNTEWAINLLLVDDKKEDLLALELILKNDHYNFFKATSGREALRILLKEHDFALILMDVNMPMLDGFETAKLIRESEKFKHIPIIFLTANDDEHSNIFKGYMRGAVDFIIKPLVPEIIKAKVSIFADLYKKTKELEEQHKSLLKSNSLNETLLSTESAMGQGVLITERDKIVFVNDAICKIWGYSKEEIFSLPSILNIIPADEKKRLAEEFEQNSKEQKMQSSGEAKIVRKDGKIIDIEYMTCNIDMEGHMQRLSIIRDITEKKQREKQLRTEKERAESAELSKKIGEQFLANMSHEIRTPMNAIVGFTNLMLQTSLTTEQNQYLDAIRTSSDNLLVIINDILDFSRMRSGKIPIEERNFKLSHIITMCVELMRPKAVEKGIKIEATIDKKIHDDLIGDATRLSQILINLTANAVKFTNKGEVSINARLLAETKNEVEIELIVEDTGIGIPQDKLTAIFEAFTQADNDTARKYGGTGLGLAIVKQLTELQNGTITVSSEEGKGSSFYFTIKYKKALLTEEDDKFPVDNALHSELTKNLSVLVVEDNSLNQLLVHKVLSGYGWKIDIVENGAEALEKAKHKNYDVILMDIQMPVMDGYNATKQIRNTLPPPKCNVPIIAMTAHVMVSEEGKCYKAGMNGYISKPFDIKDLYSKIISVLEKSGQTV